MRLLRIFALLLLSLPLAAQSAAPAAAPAQSAPVKNAAKKAAGYFLRGEEQSRKGELEQAVESYQHGSNLSPGNPLYTTALGLARQKYANQLTQQGNTYRIAGKNELALASFRKALSIDPDNGFVRQQLEQMLPASLMAPRPNHARVVLAPALRLKPSEKSFPIHYRGDTRSFLTNVAKLYGITAFIDDSVRNRPIVADVDKATWEQAQQMLTVMTKSFWIPLAANQVLFVMDDVEHRNSMQQLELCTYYVQQATSSQDLNDFANIMRMLFNIKYISVDTQSNAISIRAPRETISALSTFLEQFADTRPEVMMEIQIFEHDLSSSTNLGPSTPTEFQVFNIASELRSVMGDSAAQSIIDELRTTGTLSSTSLATVISAIASSGSSTLLTSSFFVFGGGYTFTGLTIPSISFQMNHNGSNMRLLDKLMMRSSQDKAVTFKLGSRYPIVTSTYTASSGSTTVSLSSLTSGTSYMPSFTYEDLGISVKATPIIHNNGNIQFTLEMQIRSLGTLDANNMPEIGNREYKGVISANDGEPIIIAAELSTSESKSIDGNQVTLPINQREGQNTRSQLTIVMRPHILSGASVTQPIPLPLSLRNDR